MERVAVERLTIDVCRPCRTVWLDPGELGALVAIWRRGSVAPGQRPTRKSGVSWIDAPGALDAAGIVPDLAGSSVQLGEIAVEAVGRAPELIAGVGDGAIAVVEATGQAAAEGAASAGGFLLELLGGLFDGL